MSLVADLRQRKLVQWLLAYAAGAWVLLQVVGMIGAQFGWPPGLLRNARFQDLIADGEAAQTKGAAP